jgi:hypothetical protein
VKDKEARKGRADKLVEMRADPWERAKGTWWYNQTYGARITGSEALQLEREGMQQDDEVIARYKYFQSQKKRRAEQRTTRADLLKEAGSEAAEAEELRRDLPAEDAALNQTRGLNRATADVNAHGRLVAVSQKAGEEQNRLVSSAADLVESNAASSRAAIEAMQRQAQINRELQAQMNEIQRSIDTARRQIGGLRNQ